MYLNKTIFIWIAQIKQLNSELIYSTVLTSYTNILNLLYVNQSFLACHK